ncbi:MAG: hypothetical protein GX940_00730 [Clostridiaceae bacterium]|nr:hypothetical protein [Clostridiaceae bacterium]
MCLYVAEQQKTRTKNETKDQVYGIAKNLTEAMGGRFSININGDLFEVQIAFKAS